MTAEIEKGFDDFTKLWKNEFPGVIADLDAHRAIYLQSYSRIASMNAWRASVLDGKISAGSLEFFAEAINDALVSHIWARFGAWRSALMSLRSCIENTVYSLYYKDHPIELTLWENGKHRPTFSEVHTYLAGHPEIEPLAASPVTGLAAIKGEYGMLSRAVHASAKSFRMSASMHHVVFWTSDATSLGQWRTRERHVLTALNLLLLSIFRTHLQGTQRRGLRTAVANLLSSPLRNRAKTELKINLPTS